MDIEAIFSNIGGVRPVVGDSLVPMTEAEIAAFEDQIEARLPGDYRQFQATYGAVAFNGVSPDNSLVEFRPVVPLPPTVGSTRGTGIVFRLYGGNRGENEPYSLPKNFQFYSGRIPETLVPIGDDGLGGQICLGIKGDQACKVYYWDNENEPLDEEDYLADYGRPREPEVIFQNVYLVANSFEEFLECLQPISLERKE